MRLLGLILFSFFLLSYSFTSAEVLYPVNILGKWGYINSTGKIICEPQFDYAYPFSGNMGKVMLYKNDTELLGFVDSTGRTVFYPRFDKAMDFKNGFCRVNIQDKWTFIDQSGKLIEQPIFDEVQDFREEMALIRVGEKYGFINTEGKLVISTNYLWASSFQEGLAVVKVKIQDPNQYYPEEKYGFITRKNSYFFAPIFKQAKPFSSSRAAVIFNNESSWAFMDPKGQAITNLRYSELGYYHEGMAKVRNSYYWGFVDSSGAEVVPQIYSVVGDFEGGLALVNKGSYSEGGEYRGGKWGVINKKGQPIVEPQFDSISPFYNGTAVVWKDRHPGLLFINGNFDISTNFQWIYPFQEGLARVEVNKRFGFINTRGQFMFKPVFLAASDFQDDYARILTREGSVFTLSYIAKNGTAIWKQDYDLSREYKKDEILSVIAYPGLDLMKTAEIDSKIIYTIPYGEQVTVISTSKKKPVAADGMVGTWIEVEYKGSKGFMFKPYLTKLPAPVPGMGLESYFNFKMGIINPLASLQNKKREVFHYAAVRETEVYYSRLQSEYTLLGPDIQEAAALIKAALGFAHMPIPDSFASMNFGKRSLSMTVNRASKYVIDKITFSYTVNDQNEQIILTAPSSGLIKIMHFHTY